MKVPSRRKIRTLMANVPPERRARAIGRIYDLLEDASKDLGDLSPRDRIRAARDIAEIAHKIESVSKVVTEEEAIRHKLIYGLTVSLTGPNGAPFGAPPEVATVWQKAMAGDEAALAVVQEWLDSDRQKQ